MIFAVWGGKGTAVGVYAMLMALREFNKPLVWEGIAVLHGEFEFMS